MKVSKRVKEAYNSDSISKYISIFFPEINREILHEQIEMESLRLSESVMADSNVEFVGCISSTFQIKIQKLREDIKGRKIIIRVHTDGTEDEPVTLFNGIVDSAVKQGNKQEKQITAYDELYTKGGKNVAAWYKALKFPVTLKEVRDSLFEYVGLVQVETELPNDSVQIKKQYNPGTLQAVAVMKAICQINGAFGIINREGNFEYRILNREEDQGTFPGGLYPPFYPSEFVGMVNGGAMNLNDFAFYKDLKYEEYTVKPVDMVTIRNSEDSDGVVYADGGSTGSNNYIIQGNMFTYGLPDDVLLEMAEKIYRNVGGFEYIPFQSDNNGLPFVECGLDMVSYLMVDYDKYGETGEIEYVQKKFYVLNRELTGIQALRDAYSAQGEEYQTEFITDLQTQIDLLKKKNTQETQETQQQIEDYTYSKDEIDQKFGSGGACWDIQSVPVLPTTLAANTVYLIQVETVVE